MTLRYELDLNILKM